MIFSFTGRIVTFGIPQDVCGSGLVAFTAARYAVEGASVALGQEYRQFGIKTVVLNPGGIKPDLLYAAPRLNE